MRGNPADQGNLSEVFQNVPEDLQNDDGMLPFEGDVVNLDPQG